MRCIKPLVADVKMGFMHLKIRKKSRVYEFMRKTLSSSFGRFTHEVRFYVFFLRR